jgi:cytochrome c-type biogenesis protein CcmH
MSRCLASLFLCITFAAAALTPEQEQRYQSLIAELRCLVCQNQNIAESNAPLAADLREIVRTKIAAGQSNAEIKHFVTERYGDFVLYRPPLAPRTWLLWFGPLLLLVLTGGIAAAFIRRASRNPRPTVDPAAVRRLLDEDQP